jgi:hypothetical protein
MTLQLAQQLQDLDLILRNLFPILSPVTEIFAIM